MLRLFAGAILLLASLASAQTGANTGQISGVVRDPDKAVVPRTQVTLTNQQTKAKASAATDDQGAYTFSSLPAGTYIVEVASAKGFKPSASGELKVTAGQTVQSDFALALAGVANSVTVSADSENAYRVDNVDSAGPLGTTPILDLPYSVNVISRQLIDDTQSRNFKEAAKYLPLISFQEMQGPEVLRPETRGFAGQQHAERPQGRDGLRRDHAFSARGIRADRGRQRIERPALRARQPIRHV